MAHQGEPGGNVARPSNPSGHFTPSFPTPATIGAQPSQALFQENQFDPSIGAWAPQLGHPSAADTLVPPAAVAPQTFHYFQPESHQPHWTMPQAGVPYAMPLQHFSGTAALQPLHGEELAAARVAAINTLPSQPFQLQPNNYTHGWSQAQPFPQQQAPPAPRYAALQPAVEQGDGGNPLPPPPQDAHILQRSMVALAPPPNTIGAPPPVAADDGYGATGWAPPMLPPSDWPGSWAPPVQQPGGGGGGGQTSWAPQPQAQQPGGQASSWAWAPPAQQRPGMQAASPASGSGQAQAQAPRVTGKKTFEEFLLEAGVLDQQTLDEIAFVDDVVAPEMLGDGQAELGPEERDDRFVSLGDVLVALGAVSSGPSTSRQQVPLPAQEALGASATGGRGRDQGSAAAVEARERRSRRIAMRKEAAARHHGAAPQGSQNGPGAI